MVDAFVTLALPLAEAIGVIRSGRVPRKPHQRFIFWTVAVLSLLACSGLVIAGVLVLAG
jgi:hypothetical protein